MATTATTSAPSTRARAFPLMFFVIAFAFTWLFWGLAALGARDVVTALPGLTVIGTFGPLVAAVILTAQESGGVGVRSLLGRILQWRVAPIWYAVALLGPLLITLVAMVVEVVLLGEPAAEPRVADRGAALNAAYFGSECSLLPDLRDAR